MDWQVILGWTAAIVGVAAGLCSIAFWIGRFIKDHKMTKAERDELKKLKDVYLKAKSQLKGVKDEKTK